MQYSKYQAGKTVALIVLGALLYRTYTLVLKQSELIIVERPQTVFNRVNPLDDEKHFPSSELALPAPLTVETAELCDEKKQALLTPKWFWCPEDPSCLKCARNVERNTNVTMAFKHSDHVEARATLFRKHFSNVKYNTVTVQAVNYGQAHLWLNWVCSCDAMGFDVRSNTLLVPADEEAEAIVKAAGFYSVGLDWMDNLEKHHRIKAHYDGKVGATQQHSDINNILMMTVAELLAVGNNVLMLDVDISWIQDPRPWLENSEIGADVLAMVAARWDAQGTANTGMVYFRANRRTRLLMESIVNLFPIKGASDQVLFNQVLRHYKLRQVSFHNLPTRMFPVLPGSEKHIKASSWRSEALAVHAVGSFKEQRLEEAGMFFYNTSCKVFNLNLKPWVTIDDNRKKR